MAGVYQIQFRASGLSFTPAGDSSYFTVIPAATSPPNTITTYLNTTSVYTSTGITLLTYDKYGNPTTAISDVLQVQYLIGAVQCITVTSDSGFETIMTGSYEQAFSFQTNVSHSNGTNVWHISLLPMAVGIYTPYIALNNESIPCVSTANLAFQVVPGPGWPPASLVSGPNSSIAGAIVSYRVTILDKWNNAIMRGSANPSALDVAFGVNCSAPLAALSPCPSAPVSTWLNPYSNGPMYPQGGYPGCLASAVTGLCPAVLSGGSSVITDLGNSTYVVTLLPVRAGTYRIVSTFLGGLISGADALTGSPATMLTVLPFVAALFVPPNAQNFIKITAGQPGYFDLNATDIYGNLVSSNDHNFNIVFQQIGGPYAISLTQYSQPPFQPPFSLGNGTFRVSFLIEWAGNYVVTVNLIKADGSAGSSGSVQLQALHQTCGFNSSGGISSTPYRCAPTASQLSANQPGLCASSYTACSPVPSRCSGSTPVTCSLQPLLCQDAVQNCPCPIGYSRCKSGNCALHCALPPTCPVGAPFQCLDGSCRQLSADCPSALVCPPGSYLCYDGITCANNITAFCPPFPPAPCASGLYACPSGLCVASISECPTSVTCPVGQVLCGSDHSCKASADLCQQLFECYAPNNFRCSDGSCRLSETDCPSAVTCPVGYTMCPNGHCSLGSSSCRFSFNQSSSPTSSCPLNLVFI